MTILLLAAPVMARTVVIDDTECRRMAVISSAAPRSSWAASGAPPYYNNFQIELSTSQMIQQTILIQFPLDKVPPGMRVTSAELIFTSFLVYPDLSPRLHVRRIVGDWGPGVCHAYRRTLPQRVPWTVPGANAIGEDRARRPTAVLRVKRPGEHNINVTEDVEMWCSGAAENNGWMLYVDDPNILIRMYCPPWSPSSWKLRITFEPR